MSTRYDPGMIKVLGRPTSINVRKVLWTATETGLAFTHEAEWGAERPLSDPAFLALNPNGLIPVLIGDDGVLWESNAICRYLAGVAGREDLLPTTPFARADVERWMDWQAGELNSAWRPAFMALVRGQPADADTVARSVAEWNAKMLILERHLEDGRPYVSGDGFTLADIVLGLSLQRWRLSPIERPQAPALATYGERIFARPGFLATGPGTV